MFSRRCNPSSMQVLGDAFVDVFRQMRRRSIMSSLQLHICRLNVLCRDDGQHCAGFICTLCFRPRAVRLLYCKKGKKKKGRAGFMTVSLVSNIVQAAGEVHAALLGASCNRLSSFLRHTCRQEFFLATFVLPPTKANYTVIVTEKRATCRCFSLCLFCALLVDSL